MCATLPRLRPRTRVVVVMHHVEAIRSTNTGRLAARMLDGAEVRVRGLRDGVERAMPGGPRLVLFPHDDARELTADDAREGAVLVVPDGTWTQARRIVRRDPSARDATRVRLPTAVARETAYALRRNPHEGGVCTLEAIAAALDVLEGEGFGAPLREAFTAWQDAALRVRGTTPESHRHDDTA